MTTEHEFSVPSEFEEYLDQHEVRKQELTEKIGREKQQKQRATKRKETARRKRAAEDLPYAELIFEWVRQFRESTAGRRAIAAVPPKSRPDKTLTFFEWHPGWGYSLSISGQRIRWYRFGPGSKDVYCENPKQLASAAQCAGPGMLKACLEAIQNGEVWKWIKKDLNLFVDEALFRIRGE